VLHGTSPFWLVSGEFAYPRRARDAFFAERGLRLTRKSFGRHLGINIFKDGSEEASRRAQAKLALLPLKSEQLALLGPVGGLRQPITPTV
jgi:hypothetical protein